MTSDGRTSRQQGVLTRWNDDRGFGFIEPAAGGSQVFVHVSAFPSGRRPVDGCEVTYVVVRDERNRTGAEDVRYRGMSPTSGAGAMGGPVTLLIAALFLLAVVGLVAMAELPVMVLVAYVLFSAASILLYGTDKSAAKQGRRRISESTLHTVALMGGWPGALVAQQVFRHKTIKQPFGTIFWVTVIANCAALTWFVLATPT